MLLIWFVSCFQYSTSMGVHTQGKGVSFLNMRTFIFTIPPFLANANWLSQGVLRRCMKKAIGSLCLPAFGGAIKFWPKLPKLLRENCQNFLACHCNLDFFVVIHFPVNYPPTNISPMKMSPVPSDTLVPRTFRSFQLYFMTFRSLQGANTKLTTKGWRCLQVTYASLPKGKTYFDEPLGDILSILSFPLAGFHCTKTTSSICTSIGKASCSRPHPVISISGNERSLASYFQFLPSKTAPMSWVQIYRTA